jgi:hypothetical protein
VFQISTQQIVRLPWHLPIEYIFLGDFQLAKLWVGNSSRFLTVSYQWRQCHFPSVTGLTAAVSPYNTWIIVIGRFLIVVCITDGLLTFVRCWAVRCLSIQEWCWKGVVNVDAVVSVCADVLDELLHWLTGQARTRCTVHAWIDCLQCFWVRFCNYCVNHCEQSWFFLWKLTCEKKKIFWNNVIDNL